MTTISLSKLQVYSISFFFLSNRPLFFICTSIFFHDYFFFFIQNEVRHLFFSFILILRIYINETCCLVGGFSQSVPNSVAGVRGIGQSRLTTFYKRASIIDRCREKEWKQRRPRVGLRSLGARSKSLGSNNTPLSYVPQNLFYERVYQSLVTFVSRFSKEQTKKKVFCKQAVENAL